MTGLGVESDITSLQLSWGPPSCDGSRDYLTGYLITHQLWKGINPLGKVSLERDATHFEVEGLLPNLTYEVRVQAVVRAMAGEVVAVVVATKSIGMVSMETVYWVRMEGEKACFLH